MTMGKFIVSVFSEFFVLFTYWPKCKQKAQNPDFFQTPEHNDGIHYYLAPWEIQNSQLMFSAFFFSLERSNKYVNTCKSILWRLVEYFDFIDFKT